MEDSERKDSETNHVKRSRFVINGSDRVYPMGSKPRGFCLIINNVYFENRALPTRRGSDQDADRLKDIFQQLHFMVILEENLKAEEMRMAIRRLAKDQRNKMFDAFVLIVLTHGENGFICGVDHDPDDLNRNYLTYEDVVEELNNYNAIYLRNKPKMCFFQACNGEKQSVAVEDNVGLLPSRTVEKVPVASDILLSFAAQEGFTTVRYEWAGGVYAYHLATVLMEHACNCDVLEMLNIVEKQVRDTHARAARRTKDADGLTKFFPETVDLCLSTSVKLLGWSKKLYFNPVDKSSNPMVIDLPSIDEIVTLRERIQRGEVDVSLEEKVPEEPRKPTLWVMGGDQCPEVLSADGQRWSILEDTVLTSGHEALTNCDPEQPLVFCDDNIYRWNLKELQPVTLMDPPHHMSANAVIGDKIYIMGGQIKGKVTKICKVYDMQSRTWTELEETTRACWGRGAAVLRGKIYMTPGKVDQVLHKLDVYDPEMKRWVQLKCNLNVPRCRHAIAACDRHVWVFGGCKEGYCIADVERFSATSHKWDMMKPMPTPRADLSVTYFEGRFYATGGTVVPGGSQMNVVEIYDPEKNQWTKGPSLQRVRSRHTSIVA